MNSKELLTQFVDHTINDNHDDSNIAFKEYATSKAKEIIQEMRIESKVGSALTELDHSNGIKLQGSGVYIKGKRIGKVQADLQDFESGINFISDDGTFSKEFDTVEDLYKFLSTQYGIK